MLGVQPHTHFDDRVEENRFPVDRRGDVRVLLAEFRVADHVDDVRFAAQASEEFVGGASQFRGACLHLEAFLHFVDFFRGNDRVVFIFATENDELILRAVRADRFGNFADFEREEQVFHLFFFEHSAEDRLHTSFVRRGNDVERLVFRDRSERFRIGENASANVVGFFLRFADDHLEPDRRAVRFQVSGFEFFVA